jgi:integrase
MARAKDYKAKLSGVATGLGADLGATDAMVALPPNSRNHNLIDLRPWLGRGFDNWVWAATTVLKARLNSGHYSVATIVSFASNGIKVFLTYLTGNHVGGIPLRPSDMGPADVARYIAWLRLKYPNGSTAKNYYSAFKSVVVGLMDYGFIDQPHEALLPANPFPMNAKVTKGETSLSQAEMQKLATALKADLIAIHHGRFTGLESEAIVALMLIVGMRTGINITPILEMKRDCLGPHPFMPNLMLVRTFKRRGKGSQSTSLRQTHIHDLAATIPMDGVAVLKKALEMTQVLVPSAAESIEDRVWLYRSSQRGHSKGQTLCLNMGRVHESTKAIVKRHGLSADDGSPLRVTLGRLRKTMENRLWKLSDGDLLAVSAVMGHSPQVADNHYLRLDERTKSEGAKFIGEALPAKLRGQDLVPTPTGSCKDSLQGARAPKDGSTHCAEFTHCLGCPSYAIVGTVKDLHRLFSFQRFLMSEMDYYAKGEWHEWQRHHQDLIAQIDRIAVDNFFPEMVEQAKVLAEKDPHPFWAIRMRQSQLSREARYGR